jgi:hypothetical protein
MRRPLAQQANRAAAVVLAAVVLAAVVLAAVVLAAVVSVAAVAVAAALASAAAVVALRRPSFKQGSHVQSGSRLQSRGVCSDDAMA